MTIFTNGGGVVRGFAVVELRQGREALVGLCQTLAAAEQCAQDLAWKQGAPEVRVRRWVGANCRGRWVEVRYFAGPEGAPQGRRCA